MEQGLAAAASPTVQATADRDQAEQGSPAATPAFSPAAGVALAQALPVPIDLTDQDEAVVTAARQRSRSPRTAQSQL